MTPCPRILQQLRAWPRLLLDTHVFIWAFTTTLDSVFSAKALIEEADEVYVSSASIWEIAIKAEIEN